MTVVQLIAKLGAVGIKLWLDDEKQLRFKAPKGALTADLKAELIHHKEAVIQFLSEASDKKLSDTIVHLSRDAEQEYKLSFAQQRFWFLDRLEPGNPSLHIPAAIHIQGELHIHLMRQAFDLLAQRHESLRSYFVIDAQQKVRQRIEPAVKWRLQEDYDLSHLSPAEQQQRIDEIMQQEALRPFDLNKSCQGKVRFLRTRLARITSPSIDNDSSEFILFLNMHHIIADGWSINIIIAELSHLYQSLQQGNTPTLSPLDIQYIDFAQWQRKWMKSEQQVKQLNYWQETLVDLPVLELPTYAARPKQSSYHGRHHRFSISEKSTAGFKQLAQRHNASLFSCLFAVFNILLMRHSGQKDFAVGTPVSGRNRKDIEGIIGCFINVIALRTHIDSQMSFSDYIQQVQRDLLNAFEHQDIPFEHVAEACTHARSLAHSPIFQVMFTLQNENSLSIDIEGLKLSLLPQASHTAKYDLQMHVNESSQNLECSFEYNTDLFHHDYIESLGRHFNCLVESILTNHDHAVGELNIFDPQDQQLLQLNNTELNTLKSTTLLKRLNQAANIHATATAVSCGEKEISYIELHKKAEKLAHYIAHLGLSQPARIGFCLPPGIDSVVSLLGCIKCGAAYVPLDTNLPEERLQTIIESAELNYVISTAEHQKGLDTIPASKLILLDEINHQMPDIELIPATAEDPLYLIFTSGSTGIPKAAAVSYANEENLLSWYPQQYAIDADDKIIVISSLGFDLTQKNILTSLMSGSEIVFSPSALYDPNIIAKTIANKRISLINCAPSAFYPILETCHRLDRLKYLQSLRHVLFGGEPIILANFEHWIKSPYYHASITNMYGPTECTDISCAYTLENPQEYLHNKRSIPIGSNIPGVITRVLDENLQPVPIGSSGELYIGGNSVGLGYFKQDSLTHKSFIQDPFSTDSQAKMYRSHDIVRQRNINGQLLLEFIARSDDQIKIRGFRVELGEISSQLNLHPAIQESLVLANIDDKNNQRLFAYYINHSDKKAQLGDLRQQLKQHLPDYMIPSAFIEVQKWPLSANGKINKKALPKAEDHHFVNADFVAPTGNTEIELSQIWQHALGLNDIGIHDNFFEMGGHSLIATQMIGQISETFGIDISLKDFFEQATIAELAELINRGSDIHQSSSLAPIEVYGKSLSIPLSQAQHRLWIIEQLNPGNAAYNIPAALLLKGELNIQALEAAIQTLLERHLSLRTTFSSNAEGVAEQKILAMDCFKLKHSDLSLTHLDNHKKAIQDQVNTIANTPFNDLSSPLFNAELVDVKENQWLLIFNMHHLISDGWSISLLKQELGQCYNAYCQSETPNLTTLSIQYSDYSAWQHESTFNDHQQLQLDYWLNQLNNAPALLQLPTDRPRPEQQSFNGSMLSQQLDDVTSESIKTFCQQHNMTAFNVLMSCFGLLLSKYAKQEDICIGTPVSGRERAEVQDLIGYFVNAVVIRHKLTGNPSLLEMIHRTQEICLGAFAHQDVAIEKVLDALPLTRNLSYPPVAQTGFSFISESFTHHITLDNLDVEPIDFDRIMAKYDLSCIIVDADQRLTIHFEYNTDLFDQSTILIMLNQFIQLLNTTITTPQKPINSIDLLDDNALISALHQDASDIDAVYPLTAMQHDMIMAQQLYPKSLANTVGYHVEVEIEIDPKLWEKSLQLVSNTESIARTTFHNNPLKYGEFAYQIVNKFLKVDLEIFDYRDESLSDHQIRCHVDAFIYRPDNYKEQKFIRYGLIQLNNNRSIVLMTAHHALLDGISVVFMGQKAINCYETLHQHQDTQALLSDDGHFAQYIEKDRQQVDSQITQDFWKKAFKHCEAPSFTFIDKKPKTPKTIIKQHCIKSNTWRLFKTYCRRHKTTPAQLLKLLYAVMIHSYCRTENDFSIIDFQAGRNKSNALALGCFFQQTPFVMEAGLLTGDSSIKELIQYGSIFRKKLKGLGPLSTGLFQRLSPVGRLQFMYNYYHFFPQQQTLLGHDARCIEKPPYVEGAVQLVLKEQEDHMILDLYYQNDIFVDNNFLVRLESFCQQLIDGADKISDLSLVTSKERNQQLYEFNHAINKPTNELSCLQNTFEQQVDKYAEKIAIVDDHSSISYFELNQRSNQLAHYLHDIGVGSDVPVGICLPHSIDAIVAILAVIKAGGCYIPIDSSYPSARINKMLIAAKAHVLISYEGLNACYQQFDGEVISLDALKSDKHIAAIDLEKRSNPNMTNEIEDLFYIIFTSGSTGEPKGATVTHKGIENLQSWYINTFNFDHNSKTLVISALGFDLTQKNLFAPLLTGGQLVLSNLEHYDSGKIHQLIEQHQITLINCAPSAFYPIVEDHEKTQALESLKHIIFGGESIKLERLEKWTQSTDFNAQITNNYGPTECTDIAAFYPIKADELHNNHSIPIGRSNDNTQMFILDTNQQLLPTGLMGEICIGGNGVGRGYLNHDDLNQKKFMANPFSEGQLYRTGDLGAYQQDGNIHFIQREDFQVKLNGLRIELAEIETILCQQDDISECVIMVINEQLIAYIIHKANTLDEAHIRQQMNLALPSYMQPKTYVSLQQWPLTSNGKIDRKALSEIDILEVKTEYIAANSETEKVICSIVANILSIEKVGILDNFFDLGGHSLAASRAIVQIRDHFSIDIPLNILFELHNIKALAQYIDASQWALKSSHAEEENMTQEDHRDTGFI